MSEIKLQAGFYWVKVSYYDDWQPGEFNPDTSQIWVVGQEESIDLEQFNKIGPRLEPPRAIAISCEPGRVGVKAKH